MNFARHLAVLAITSIVFTAAALAADVSGKWIGQVPTRDSATETTFVFKVEGEKLTGTISGLQGERPIVDGKVSGDSISFTVENPDRGNQVFKGTVAGDELKMTRTGRRGEPRPFTAKRVK